MMIKRCDKCNKRFKVEANPDCRTEKIMVIPHGRRHKEKLCPRCWTENRKVENMKGNKKYGRKGIKLIRKINTKGNFKGVKKYARNIILKRNEYIDKLNSIVERLSIENIKLKEELHVLRKNKTKTQRRK